MKDKPIVRLSDVLVSLSQMLLATQDNPIIKEGDWLNFTSNFKIVDSKQIMFCGIAMNKLFPEESSKLNGFATTTNSKTIN